jgi:ribosomal protein L11 methyltransferase
MGQSWSALELELPGRLEEEVLGVLGPTCLGAEFRPSGSDGGCLVAYFATSAAAREASRSVEALLRRHELDTSARVRRIEDGRWVERYQAALHPMKLGRGFLVDPTGKGATAAGRRRITLVPGRAFGTGEHATTRLCAAALERCVQRGSRWVDLGCGSGILAIVARHCGAAEVLALDVDPEAVRVALEVVRRNEVADAIRVEQGTQADVTPGSWDGLVANITATYFLESAGRIAGGVRPGGTLIASGIPAEQCDEVCSALVGAELTEVGRETLEDWAVLVLQRPAPERD